MNRFHPHIWIQFSQTLETLQRLDADMEDEEDRKTISNGIAAFEPDCKAMGLTASAITIRKIKVLLERPAKAADYRRLAQELQGRLEDDMGEAVYLSLSSAESSFFKDPNPFGDDVASAFPSTRYDIEEAAKSLALDRHTACVFHLMRVMEVALRVVAASLPGVSPAKNPTWEAILDKGRKELEKPAATRDAAWVADEGFFSEVIVHLSAVKTAWRNPTMHVEAQYDGARAVDIYSNVRRFMTHAATKLRE